MLKLLITLIAIVLVGYIGVYLIDTDGYVVIHWFGYQLESSSLLFVIMTIIVFILVFFIILFLSKLKNLSKDYRKMRKLRGYEKGLEVVTQMVDALFVKDMERAISYKKKLKKYLHNSHIEKLFHIYIYSQSNAQKQDRKAVLGKKHSKKIDGSDINSAFILQALAESKIKQKNYIEALNSLKQALNYSPKSKLLFEMIIDVLMKANRKQEAIEYINRYATLFNDSKKFKQALIILYNLIGRELYDAETYKSASKFFLNSVNESSDSFSIIYYAKSLYKLEKYNLCQKFILSNWLNAPHSSLIILYDKVIFNNNIKTRIKNILTLLQLDKNNEKILCFYADLLIKDTQFDKAKDILLSIVKQKNIGEAYRLLIMIEEIDNGNINLIKKYYKKLEDTIANPKEWQCCSCKEEYYFWSSQCYKCNALANIDLIKESFG